MPPQGVLTLKVDGAIFNDQKIVGVGVMVRDEKGTVLMPASEKEKEVLGPEEVELLAMLEGL